MNTKTNLTNGGEGPSGRVHSEETRAKLSEKARQYWADPEARARVSEQTRQRMSSPEARARLSEQMRQYWADPEARARQSERKQQYWAAPKVRAQRSGRIWINNGTENRQLKPGEPMPAGFRLGLVKRSFQSRAA